MQRTMPLGVRWECILCALLSIRLADGWTYSRLRLKIAASCREVGRNLLFTGFGLGSQFSINKDFSMNIISKFDSGVIALCI